MILQGKIAVGEMNGQPALIMEPGGVRSYVMPLTEEAAKIIGEGLLAPRVVKPSAVLQPNGRG